MVKSRIHFSGFKFKVQWTRVISHSSCNEQPLPFSLVEVVIHFGCSELDSDASSLIIRLNAIKNMIEGQNFRPKKITAQSFHI